MLKMGDNAGAIELLETNAKDYPGSSTSAFGLGRAYRSAGDLAPARRELERAIDLGPKNRIALEALAEITR